MQEWLEVISEPLKYAFIQRALIIAVIIAICCAILSCFLILKGWLLLGDAISHAVLPGIVLSFILSIPISVGAFGSGLFCALSAGYLKSNTNIRSDAILGIVVAGMFSIGIILFSKITTDQHLMHILFGNLLGITESSFKQTIIICSITLAITLVKYKDFMLFSLDPTQAYCVGLSTKLLNNLLLILLALTIVTSIQAAGVILVVALIICPAVIAITLCRGFVSMLIIAISASIIASVGGVFLSYHMDIVTGASIVAILSLLAFMSFIFKLIQRIYNKKCYKDTLGRC